MNKEIEQILKGSPVKIKWNNMGTWTKEKKENLFDCVRHLDMKLTTYYDDDDRHRMVNISYTAGNYRHLVKCHWVDFERAVAQAYGMYLLYLGDDVNYDTRFRDYKIRR